MAIVKPEEMDFQQEKNIIMIISGLPGVGKRFHLHPDVAAYPTQTRGMAQVNKFYRKDSSICKT